MFASFQNLSGNGIQLVDPKKIIIGKQICTSLIFMSMLEIYVTTLAVFINSVTEIFLFWDTPVKILAK